MVVVFWYRQVEVVSQSRIKFKFTGIFNPLYILFFTADGNC